MMTCEEARRAVLWLLDDEIEPLPMLELEAHLSACAQCREAMEEEVRLRRTLRRAVEAVVAPASLRRRIRETVERERRASMGWGQIGRALAAAVVLLAFVWKGSMGTWLPELEEATRRHAHDLPMDVVAADVGSVQQYFQGKLPFAVQLPQVNSAAWNSLGGRITKLRDRDAAYVRYEMNRGHLSVFVYEDTKPDVSEGEPLYQFGTRRVFVHQLRGYTVARWRSSGLVYSVVTDLPDQEVPRILSLEPRPASLP